MARAERVASRSDAIIGGGADADHPAVVALVRRTSGSLCSGTLVAPTLVLTAAHCVYGVAPSDLEVRVGADETKPDLVVPVTRADAYPTYASESEGLAGGIDLAIVTLSQALAAMPIGVSTTTTDAAFAGATVTLVGYGVASATDSSQVGVRRAVDAHVDGVCSRLLTLGTSDANECFGDSGGAVLLQGKLVAVISSGQPDCTAPSHQTRLDAHADWIAAALAGNASAACPTCVAANPSCFAATETRPAGAPPDAGDAAAIDPSRESSALPTGCSTARGASANGSLLVVAAIALLARARTSERRRR
jgi:secreted trypsin-like serine protease